MESKHVCFIVCGLVVIVLVSIIALVASSFQMLDSTEVAIQYDSFTNLLMDEPYFEGLHLGTIGFKFVRFASVFKTLSYYSLNCRNYDGVPVSVDISFQYRPRPADLKMVVTQFRDEDGYEKILKPVGSSAIHDSCSKFTTSQFQSERGRFQDDLTERLSEKFEFLKCDVQDLQVNDIRRPPQYDRAIHAKESAREDISVARSEKPRYRTEANTTKREAMTEAQIIKNLAETEAKILTNRAIADAKGILNDYQKEAESYKMLKEANGLDNEGFLAYMGVRAIANAKNPVHVGMQSPARTSFS